MKSTGYYSTGNCSTGNCSTGNYLTGNYSTGNWSTGDYSTGNYSTGHGSTGYCSTGYKSTGNCSTGNYSTGSWSTSNNSTGHFSTIDYMGFSLFNIPCDPSVWMKCKKPYFIYRIKLTEWVYEGDMTEKEKSDNPTYETTGGFLKVYDYKEAWRIAYDNATDEDIEKLKNLPHFDADVFKEISGIDVRERNKIKVTANGKTVYISKESAETLGLL